MLVYVYSSTCMNKYVAVCTSMYWYVQYVLVGTKINKYVLISVPSGTSSYLESCIPEWTSTKALFCLVQLGTGLFRCTGFKGSAWYSLVLRWERNYWFLYQQVHTGTYQYILVHTYSYILVSRVVCTRTTYVLVHTGTYLYVPVFVINILVCTRTYRYIHVHTCICD